MIKVVSELIRLSKEDFEQAVGIVYFYGGEEADRLLNDFDNYPHAFVLGALMDKQVPAERAWAIPYKVYKELGNFDIDFLASISLDEYKEMFTKGGYHRFNNDCATEFYEAIHKIKNDYDGDASKIWKGNPTSKTIVRRFREFKGAGPKISTMAANILIRQFKIPISDYEAIDVSVDVQVEKVMARLGLVSKDPTKQEIIDKAREMNPEYPGLIDRTLWKVGREYCDNTNPKCDECPLKNECKYYLKSSDDIDDDRIKIISWNCNRNFREKYISIIEEDADIYVICECENPKEYDENGYPEFAGSNYYWTGDLRYMGLGIFAKDNIKLEPIKGLDERFKNFIALRVNDSFNLLGVWAMGEDKEEGLNEYVEMIHDYFDANSELFDENLIMCGDFNSNAIWDNKHKAKDNEGNAKDQTNLNIKLNKKELFSVYHDLNNEEQGEETNVTFFQTRHLNQSYHIDYVYAKKGAISEFEILDHWNWISLSDHLPLVFKLD